jgi:hypothetical protein
VVRAEGGESVTILHTIFGEPRDTFDPATAGPDTRKTTLLVQSEGPPETATHFWVNGHRHARSDIISMVITLTSTPGVLRDGMLTCCRVLGGIFTDDEMAEIGFDMAGP